MPVVRKVVVARGCPKTTGSQWSGEGIEPVVLDDCVVEEAAPMMDGDCGGSGTGGGKP